MVDEVPTRVVPLTRVANTDRIALTHAAALGYDPDQHIKSTDAGLTGVPRPTPPIGFTLPPPTVLRLAPISQDGRPSPPPASPPPTTDAAMKLWRVRKRADSLK